MKCAHNLIVVKSECLICDGLQIFRKNTIIYVLQNARIPRHLLQFKTRTDN